jgi:DNA-binding beta-propeller fold protein YncE
MTDLPTAHRRRRAGAAAAAALLSLALVFVSAAPVAANSGTTPSFVGSIGGPSHAQIYPGGAEVAPNGDIVVADLGNNQVVRMTTGGSEVWRVGAFGTGTGQFQHPRDIGIDSSGDVWVADAENKRVVELGPAGAWLGSFTGPTGDKMGVVLGVTVSGDRVYVTDSGKNKVRILDLNGTQTGQIVSSGSCAISQPRDAAADAAGNVFVANYGPNTILKFSAAGSCLTSWGGTGSTNGKLRKPYGVAVATDPIVGAQAVYVADANNNRVQEFTLSGSFLTKVGTYGAPDVPGTLYMLRRVAVAADGSLWASDTWGYLVEHYQRTSSGYTWVGSIGQVLPAPTSTAVFQEPRQVGVDASGTIYAVDTVHHRFAEFDQAGNLQRTCGTRAFTLGNFNWPRGLAVDPATGQLWVLDTKQYRVQIIRPDCSGVALFGTSGKGTSPGQFNWPYQIAIRGDGIAFIADTNNNRVVSYDVASRTQLGAFGVRGSGVGNMNQPSGIAISPVTGHVFVADANNNRVIELSSAAGKTFTWVTSFKGFNRPRGVAVDSLGRVYVADSGNNRVVILDATGAVLGTLDTPTMNDPEAVAVDPTNGRIYVSDTLDDEILVYDWTNGADGAAISTSVGSRP